MGKKRKNYLDRFDLSVYGKSMYKSVPMCGYDREEFPQAAALEGVLGLLSPEDQDKNGRKVAYFVAVVPWRKSNNIREGQRWKNFMMVQN